MSRLDLTIAQPSRGRAKLRAAVVAISASLLLSGCSAAAQDGSDVTGSASPSAMASAPTQSLGSQGAWAILVSIANPGDSSKSSYSLAVYRPGQQNTDLYPLLGASYDRDGMLLVSADWTYALPHRTVPDSQQSAMAIDITAIKTGAPIHIDLFNAIPNLGPTAKVLGAIFDPKQPRTLLVTIDPDGINHQAWAVPVDGQGKAELRYTVKANQDASLGRSTLDGSWVDSNKESTSKGHPYWTDLPRGVDGAGGTVKGQSTMQRFTLRDDHQIAVWQKASGTPDAPDQGWTMKETVNLPVAVSQLSWAMPLYR